MWKVHYALLIRPRIQLFMALVAVMVLLVVAEKHTGHGPLVTGAVIAAGLSGLAAYIMRTGRRRIALHEAGHVVMSWLLPTLPGIRWVESRRMSGDTQLDLDDERWESMTYDPRQSREFMIMLFGGIAVEMRHYGLPSSGGLGDYQKALGLSLLMNLNGISYREDLLNDALQEAKRLAEAHSDLINRVADALEARGRLETCDLEPILGPRPAIS